MYGVRLMVRSVGLVIRTRQSGSHLSAWVCRLPSLAKIATLSALDPPLVSVIRDCPST